MIRVTLGLVLSMRTATVRPAPPTPRVCANTGADFFLGSNADGHAAVAHFDGERAFVVVALGSHRTDETHLRNVLLSRSFRGSTRAEEQNSEEYFSYYF